MKEIFGALKKSLVGLMGSKKFMAAVVSIIVWIAAKFGAELEAEEILPLVAPLWGYIAAMIGADWGKSAKEAEVANDNKAAAEAPAEKPEAA